VSFWGFCGASSFQRVLSTNSFGAHRASPTDHTAQKKKRTSTSTRHASDMQALVTMPEQNRTNTKEGEVEEVANR
jgi:hypothetical protein